MIGKTTDRDKWRKIVTCTAALPNLADAHSNYINSLIIDHPAYSPKECYGRVDRNLRTLLKRRQLPMVSVFQSLLGKFCVFLSYNICNWWKRKKTCLLLK